MQRLWESFISDLRVVDRSPWDLFVYKNVRISLAVRVRIHGGLLTSFLAKLYLSRFFIEVGKTVTIGQGFKMPHPRNIIIADTVVIGDNVHINHGVTIGGNFKRSRLVDGQRRKVPIIGNSVTILTNAVIGGPIVVEDSVVVSANSVVTKDIPKNSIVFMHNQIKRVETAGSVQEYLRSKDTAFSANRTMG